MPEIAESLSRWNPVDSIRGEFISAEVFLDFPFLAIRLTDGATTGGAQPDLIFNFERVEIFQIADKLSHPSQDLHWANAAGNEHQFIFPCFIVQSSGLLTHLNQSAVAVDEPAHYRICTTFFVYEVVASEKPLVYWWAPLVEGHKPSIPSWASSSAA